MSGGKTIITAPWGEIGYDEKDPNQPVYTMAFSLKQLQWMQTRVPADQGKEIQEEIDLLTKVINGGVLLCQMFLEIQGTFRSCRENVSTKDIVDLMVAEGVL